LQMALGILEQRAQDGETTYIRSAAEKAEQIASLVTELLSFSKASFGPAAVHLKPVRLRDITEEAIRREKNEEAEIALDVPEGLFVAADPDLLIRAIANVLRNALRHAPHGVVTIQARRNGSQIAMTVADSGPGVPEEELPKIFDAFHRVDSSRTRETGGVGLGLTIVKACIDSCGGSIIARNRQPHGLEVTFQLSAATAEEENLPTLTEAAR
jgi:two-component system sensor histidine kinase CpxA